MQELQYIQQKNFYQIYIDVNETIIPAIPIIKEAILKKCFIIVFSSLLDLFSIFIHP